MKVIETSKQLYGYEIKATVTLLEKDIHVLLTGGCLWHTGAVSMFCNGIEEGLIIAPNHKEGEISKAWANAISKHFNCRATVVCGIHYDNATKEMIKEIVKKSDEMLQDIITQLMKEKRG